MAKLTNTRPVHVLPGVKTVALKAARHTFGSTKAPSLTRISGVLTSCPNLKHLDIDYQHRRGQGQQLPVADDFFLCSRWPALRSLSLTNLHCSTAHGLSSPSVSFTAHANIEVLHLDLPFDRSMSGSETRTGVGPMFILSPNALPKLRELKCRKKIATAILTCPTDSPRPLEILKGITLSGSDPDSPFLASLKRCGGSMRRVELAGWNDLGDIRRLVECVPKLTWLDVNKHRCTYEGEEQTWQSDEARHRRDMPSNRTAAAPYASLEISTNVAEWAAVLYSLSELTTFIGVKFFYEVSTLTLATLATSSPTSLSPSELSRVRKNDKVAGVLGNKCLKLRRVDYWEESATKVIVLLRNGNEEKWNVKRLKV